MRTRRLDFGMRVAAAFDQVIEVGPARFNGDELVEPLSLSRLLFPRRRSLVPDHRVARAYLSGCLSNVCLQPAQQK